ncbi:4Fe-4S dicluster domain-containing protein [Duncaniella dubosii]|uniref:4Fe-4S dicluster domain-containing protein n=1 Tax=Duncaniella dubosii TaxID=2518971 RepID=A0A4P7VZN5_9BACT|nr:4Fe-4S binding protein [Duncaniella dubosii]QCD41029.1 4Fe-4S dicluster domain-containing protein [Duncaniella dubosii]
MRTHVFYNLPESACYGCQACAQICPVGAIEMLNNREGFLYPKINSTKCIECNLCEKTCPTQENVVNPLFHTLPKDVQAAWNINFEDRLTSTSGGIFYVLGRKWIENGGIVYGVDFDDHLNVVHTRVNNIAGLQRLRGSKYVQSDITGILQQVKDDLKNGLKVLFSGTPCQVGGLRTFLKKIMRI